ncbi:MAG: polyphenol oxidase family protein [Treponema sp.]|nr:polyphenol oxidase family protein [Treponema sp.]
MIPSISIKSGLEHSASQSTPYITVPFYFDGKPLDSERHARWGITLLAAGTMRFRWNETNENRAKTLKQICSELKKPVCSGNCSSDEGRCDCKLRPVPVELIHSKIVIEADSETDTKQLQADGIITKNPLLVPVVTVADCVPIFLYDTKTKAFGAFHSGWKGTGIAGIGVQKFIDRFGSKPEHMCAAIGPHIDSCCYFVDEERAAYFSTNFGEKCVSKADGNQKFPYRLSLTEANLFVLQHAGIKKENIVVAKDCTCCTQFKNGAHVFGSFRRQAAFLPPEVDSETRSRAMTVQAAFCYMS